MTFESSEAGWKQVHESLLSPPKAEVLQKAKAVPLTPLPFEVTEEAPVARHDLRRPGTDPDMQPMKSRYHTIANLHRIAKTTVTQYKHRDGCINKSKNWAQGG